ncbi:MAG: hypothetical protein NWF02_08295, partial [Candidatus Bathyarchaeota archaeon]|nr:hypothetical protein [Candidatus Bathyarchaeum sp.]
TITSSKKPRFFIIEEEGRLDFLSYPSSTSNHKLPNIEVQMIKWIPQTAERFFSCCSLPRNHLNKTNHIFSKHN